MSDEIVRLAREVAAEARDAEEMGGQPDLMRTEPEIPAEWVEYMADRIEELEAENKLLKTAGIIEVAAHNNRLTEYMFHWEGRALDAEAKLARVEDFICRLERFAVQSKDGFLLEKAQEALAELKGGKDE